MKERFIKVLATLIGADQSIEPDQPDPEQKQLQTISFKELDEITMLLVTHAEEIERLKELVSVLVLTSPHMRIAAMEPPEGTIISGSTGRVLN